MASRLGWLVLAVGLGLGSPAEATAAAADEFVTRMIVAVEATTVDCDPSVLEATRARSMRAVCATFDGDFPAFRESWDERAHAEETGLVAGTVRIQAQTEWDSRGGTHERIYSVGATAIGVRFERGAVLFVHP